MEGIYWGLFLAQMGICSAMLYADTHRNEVYTYVTNIYDKYLQDRVKYYAISALTTYSQLKNKISKISLSIYTCHPSITYMTDVCLYRYKWVVATYNKYPIEPVQTTWISMNNLMLCGREQPSYFLKNIEKYTYIYDNDPMSSTHTFIRKFNIDAFSLSQIHLNCIYNEKLLYAKVNNIVVSRVQSNVPIKLDNCTDFNVPSTVKFLSVSVKIGLKKYTIDIDKTWLYVNNELFSKTFLKRYFDYHNISVQFTNEYIVDIMDNNINMFQLKAGEYIQLNKNHYVIKCITN